MSTDALREFLTARLDEDEAHSRERGLSLWRRPWERQAVAYGSVGALRLIATGWRDHPDYRPEWRPAR